MVGVTGKGRDANLLFSVRSRSEDVVLHVADITTYAKGKRVEPNSTHEIDPVREIDLVSLTMPLPQEPSQISVLPATTSVRSRWEEGMLHLELAKLKLHAAVVLKMDPPERLGPMPKGTPQAPVRQYETDPVMLSEDFETTPVGKFPVKAIWSPIADAKTAIAVTESSAAGGKRSLEFVDSPDARRPFIPYLIMQPRRLDRGKARFSCDVRLEPGARVDIELRDGGQPFITGPSLRFAEDGDMLLNGKELTSFGIGEWLGVEITFNLGGNAPVCDVVIRKAVGEERFEGVAYRDPKFTECAWIGIISYSPDPAKFQVDNVKLERLER